jgi:hypothetical protein
MENKMTSKKLTFKEIWTTLRSLDLSHLEYKKQSLTYIGWADMYAQLMDIYPQAEYKFHEPVFYGVEGKQTCEVSCTINIGEISRTMTLPIMTSSLPMKSIVNPSSRDINDGQMRCLVKCCGMFGLGLYLWEKKQVAHNYKKGTNEGNIMSIDDDFLGA